MMAIGNSMMLLYLVLRDQAMPWWAAIPGFGGIILCMALYGFIEFKLGTMDHEQEFFSRRNPQMQELLEMVGEIRAKQLP